MATGTELLHRLGDVSARCVDTAAPAPAIRDQLTALTDDLALTRGDYDAEYQRFLDVQGRDLPPVPESVARHLHGARIVVTGGTGCIGTVLLRQLRRFGPARLTCLTRGATVPPEVFADVNYARADVRDRAEVRSVLERERPDIVFHLAAVRDPGLAQLHPVETIATNVLGTRATLDAAIAAGATRFVYASTGKAMRFYTRDVYAAAKKLGEAVVAGSAERIGIGAARFTHVVDNSLIHQKLRVWMREGVIRLHAPEVAFYAQSALESAQLLLMATDTAPGRAAVLSLRDLGCYFDLVDLALGVRQRMRSSAGILFTGFTPGYESTAYRGQYDPRTLDEAGPLINALEAARARGMHHDRLNRVPLRALDWTVVADDVEELGRLTRWAPQPERVIEVLDRASERTVGSTFGRAPHEALLRIRNQVGPTQSSGQEQPPGPEHAVVDRALARTLDRMAIGRSA